MPRTIAIGDIHGCATALAAILRAIDPQPLDTLVTLGDYVDRGPDSAGVLEQMIALGRRCRHVPLLGNHEEMLIASRDDSTEFKFWLRYGGQQTLASYGSAANFSQIPAAHWQFIEGCRVCWETERHFFTHASYEPDAPLDQQEREVLLWQSLRDVVPGPHRSGKIVVVGHTPQPDGRMLDLGYLKCLDTGCCYGGWLTACDVESGMLWQSDNEGAVR